MLNNSSPSVSTFEEFETGALPKQSWGGIPDMWFTAELINLADAVLSISPTEAGLRIYSRSVKGTPKIAPTRKSGCWIAVEPCVLNVKTGGCAS